MLLPQLDFRRTPVTLIIAAVAVALEVACTVDDAANGAQAGRRLYYYNELLGILPSIWTGQVWRPFTSTLLHGGLLHAAFNVYWLLRFGSFLEQRFGSYRTLGLIVLLGYVSMLPQFVVSHFVLLGYASMLPNSVAGFLPNPGHLISIVGLSGVIYGLFGVLLVGRRWDRRLDAVCDAATVQFLLFWFVFCIVLTYLKLLPVANTAHGSGLLFGVLYGLAIFDTRRRVTWIALASIATLLVLAIMIP